MRNIKRIVVHCTDTRNDATIASICNYWRKVKGWDMPGYHILIDALGICVQLADIDYVVNGAKGYNANSIHIGYIGREPSNFQLKALREEIDYWLTQYKDIPVIGHRDLPGANKTCPNFNVIDWYYNGSLPK